MEFPKLGTHCSANDCRKLDFLPMKCDACSNTYCRDHITYGTHTCEGSHKKDKVVPSCPLCGKVIPILHGQDVNVVVNRHIDSDCQSDPAKERRNIVYVNSCSQQGCKKREAVPFNCIKCHKNFCLKHRLETDHVCKTSTHASSRPVPAAPKTNFNDVIPNGMSEDEALARALQMSLESAPAANRPQTSRPVNASRSAAQTSGGARSSNNRRSEDICSLS